MAKVENVKTATGRTERSGMEWPDRICQQIEIPINQLIIILMLI